MVACSSIIRDETSKKFTYVDVFQALVIPKGIDSYPLFFAVGGRLLGVQPGLANVVLKLQYEDGEVLANSKLSGEVLGGDLDVSARFDLVPITKAGKYYIKVEYNGVAIQDNDRFYIVVTKAV